MNYTHDPREYIRQLQQILVSGNKRIGFLLGAGASMIRERPIETIGDKVTFDSLVPGTKKITEDVVSIFTVEKEAKAIDFIKKELESEGKPFHVENLLSRIVQKEQVVGAETLCGLTKGEFKSIKKRTEEKIRDLVSVHKEADILSWIKTHQNFAVWANEARRKSGIEIFTTNYDYLLEIAYEKNNYPYIDGFVGSYQPFFYSASVEDHSINDQWSKIWKIHGSLGWDIDSKTKKIIKADKNIGSIIIFPSIEKYDNSKKQPYVSYLDRLSRFIKSEDSVLFVCGYSFNDDHINEIILTSLGRSRTGCVICLLFDSFTEASPIYGLARNEPAFSVYGKRDAIVGGRFGKWMLKSQPSIDDDIQIGTYFLQDAPEPRTASGKGDEENPMTGDFTLVDFAKFVEFIYRNSFSRK